MVLYSISIKNIERNKKKWNRKKYNVVHSWKARKEKCKHLAQFSLTQCEFRNVFVFFRPSKTHLNRSLFSEASSPTQAHTPPIPDTPSLSHLTSKKTHHRSRSDASGRLSTNNSAKQWHYFKEVMKSIMGSHEYNSKSYFLLRIKCSTVILTYLFDWCFTVYSYIFHFFNDDRYYGGEYLRHFLGETHFGHSKLQQ